MSTAAKGETWEPEYREALRRMLAEKGRPVLLEEPRYSWQQDGDPDDNVSTYGWVDYEIEGHLRGGGCSIVIPEGSVVREKSYSQFQDTDTDNKSEVGLNVGGCHCRCEMYSNFYVRWTGSVGDAIRALFPPPVSDKGRGIQL